MEKSITLADLEGFTQEDLKNHIVNEYSSYGNDSEKLEISELLSKYEIVIAYESVGSWGCDSSSYFLLKHKLTGEYFETHGSHCSCYGFEGQFQLEPAPLQYLNSDKFNFYTGGYDEESESNKEKVINFIKTL